MKYFTALSCVAWLASSAIALSDPPDRSPQLFTSHSLVRLTVQAPFGQLFAVAREKPASDMSVDGQLSYLDPDSQREVNIDGIKVSVRGNTSRRDSECAFPKLRIELPRDGAPANSLFAGVAAVKVGTHCGERPDGALTKLGRWANDKSPIREAFVYQLLAAIEVPTLKARVAEIRYVDGANVTVRHAMLLEDDAAAIARLGAAGELQSFDNAREDFAVDDAAAVVFAQAMIGNFDWAMKAAPDDFYRNDHVERLWNVLALRRDEGGAFPLIYDFDLAGVVTGSHPWFPRVYYEGFVATKSRATIEVLGQVQRTRTLFGRAVLDRTRRRFLAAKPAADRTLADATLDEAGRRFAQEYLDSFFDAIAADRVFYRPVVVRPNALPYLGASGDREACGPGDRIPVGTAVTDPLEQDGGRVQVGLLDVLWHWASRCEAVHRGPVWVDADAIGTEYPAR